jgi:Zn-dependent protease with chaperone function
MNEADPIYPGGAFEGEDDSAAVVGQITVSMFSVRFETEGFTLDMPTQGLEIWIDDSGERVFFSHPNYAGWTVYSLDPTILQHRSFQQQFLKQRVDQLKVEQTGTPKHTLLVYSVLSGIIFVLFGLWAFSNVILGVIVAAMPSSWETQIGDSSFRHLTAIIKPLNDPAYTNRLYLVTQRLKKGFPDDAPKFNYIVGDDDMVNAFALPGGHVVVMRGLIEEATPDELAGVLSHEVSHVIRKHGMRHLAQMIGPVLVIKYLFNADGALAAMIAVSAKLSDLQYSRANETEADDRGFDTLVKANIDPRSLTSFFRKIQVEERRRRRGDDDYFSTHPATSARIKHLEQRWQELPRKSGFVPVNGGPDPKPLSPQS